MKVKKSAGLLKVEDVTPGMKVLIYSEPTTRVWRDSNGEERESIQAKVRLPDGTKKLASIFGFSQDACIDRWGNETENWVGRILECVIRAGQNGNYVVFSPTDEPRDMSVVNELTPEQIEEIQTAREKELNNLNVEKAEETEEVAF